ncbi:MAG: ABC transporter permease subunit [Candidatus Eisenbacteria bacterium]|nr:ABC transporter permease subunit [Candidatus Eisenbacteria bacterium]
MIVPFVWMISTSLKSPIEILSFPPTWIPTGHYLEVTEDQWIEVYVVSRDEAAGTVTVQPVESVDEPAGVPAAEGEMTVDESRVDDRIRLRFRNYVEAWNQAPFARYYFNTIFVTLFVVAGVLVTSSLAAYAFARMKFWGRDNIFVLFLSMMMVPQPVYIVPSYIILVKLGMIDTYQALIVPWIAHIFSIFLLRQHFKTIPNDLYDAAIIDGCSRFGFLWRVMLPLSKAVLVAVVIFTIVGTWNSFLWPLVMTNTPEVRPLQVGLARFSQEQGTNHELMMAAAAFSIAPLIVAYFFAQKQIIQSLATSGMKS